MAGQAGVHQLAAPVAAEVAGVGLGHPGVVAAEHQRGLTRQVAVQQAFGNAETLGVGRRHHQGRFNAQAAAQQVVGQRQATEAVRHGQPDHGRAGRHLMLAAPAQQRRRAGGAGRRLRRRPERLRQAAADGIGPGVQVGAAPVGQAHPHGAGVFTLQAGLPMVAAAAMQTWHDQQPDLLGARGRQGHDDLLAAANGAPALRAWRSRLRWTSPAPPRRGRRAGPARAPSGW